MKEIKPIKKVDVSVVIPGSKSITNRAFVISSLCKGKSKIKGPLYSDDTKYLINALNLTGIKTEKKQEYINIYGKGAEFNETDKEIFVGNAGTAMRFLTSLLTFGKGEYFLTGEARMKQRPIRDLVEAINGFGGNIEYAESTGYPPLKIKAKRLSGGQISIPGNKSSQYVSSLLMAAPLLENGLEINVKGELVSKPYIDTTIKVMNDFGVKAYNENYSRFLVPGKQRYKKRVFKIPGDASSASYFMAAGALFQGKVKIENVGSACDQGDIEFASLLEKMGAKVHIGKNSTVVHHAQGLKGIECDLNNTPDIAQTLCVVALFADSPSLIKNIGNLRIKETDRLEAMENELLKLGARVKTGNDWIKITPVKAYKPAIIETYNDHRMAMSFSIAGLKIPGIQIRNPEVVSKSFPDFWDKFEACFYPEAK